MGASIKTILFSLFLLSSANLSAAINSKAMTAENSESTKENAKTAQMVNLNLKIKAKNQTVKSELMMPFYQTAEFERKFGDKNVLIEMSPKRGKNPDEIALEMRFYKAEGSKAFYKKEIIAKVNEESYISFKGMSVKVTPVL